MRTLLVVSAVVLTLAGCRGRWRTEHPDRLVPYMSKRLKLDSTQTQALRDVALRMKSTRAAVEADREDIRSEFAVLLASDKFDKGRARSFLNARQESMASDLGDAVDKLAIFHDSLTPEQRQKLGQLLVGHRDRRR